MSEIKLPFKSGDIVRCVCRGNILLVCGQEYEIVECRYYKQGYFVSVKYDSYTPMFLASYFELSTAPKYKIGDEIVVVSLDGECNNSWKNGYHLTIGKTYIVNKIPNRNVVSVENNNYTGWIIDISDIKHAEKIDIPVTPVLEEIISTCDNTEDKVMHSDNPAQRMYSAKLVINDNISFSAIGMDIEKIKKIVNQILDGL